jgi:hypothetical protein
LVPARKRKRRRQDYKRWQREEPMQLWQLDVTGSVFLADGTELKLISGLDDCSRFCVIAKVVRRATGRAVRRAFVAAMAAYGIPDEVLTDNGKVFTGRFGKPRPAEVLFERICRKNGIKQLPAKPYSPTTIGKVERWHQSLQTDFLNDAEPFATIEAAQAAVDAWRQEYNHDRPHQSLDMATPASKFSALAAGRGGQAVPMGACGPGTAHQPAVTTRCCSHGSRACQLAGCGPGGPGGSAVGELVGRRAAVLAQPRPRRAKAHPLDRHHHLPPEHRRMADQNRALPPVRGGPGPAAQR